MDITFYTACIYDVMRAIFDVHHELGPGLNEYCYQEGLMMQLDEAGIPYVRELGFHPLYHGRPLKAEYRIDFLCKSLIIVECKAVNELTNAHRAQLFNYMRLLGKPCGILVNFSPEQAYVERYLYDKATRQILTIKDRPFRQLR